MIKKMTGIKNMMKKESECLNDTPPEEMEENVSDKKITRVKIMIRKKNLDA